MRNVELYEGNKIVQLLINRLSCTLKDAGVQELEACVVHTVWAITRMVLTLVFPNFG